MTAAEVHHFAVPALPVHRNRHVDCLEQLQAIGLVKPDTGDVQVLVGLLLQALKEIKRKVVPRDGPAHL